MTATDFNQQTIDRFHATAGRGIAPWGDNLLLMTSTAALTGRKITTPLVNRRRGRDYVVVASKGGAPDDPQWLTSIRADPRVTVEVPAEHGTETFQATARVVASGPERDQLYAYMTEAWPAFADYEVKAAGRLIPVVVLTPETDPA